MTKLIFLPAVLLMGYFINPNKNTKSKSAIEIKVEKALNIKALSPCQQACKNKLTTNYNLCTHLAPANREACITKAFDNYEKCLAACK
jgi:5-formaminoimidazole-4-carboxamide-1-beta-D-ribofuranosyl 5'-monophosphate synthetase